MKRESLKQMLKKSGFEWHNIHILDIIFIRINIILYLRDKLSQIYLSNYYRLYSLFSDNLY